MNTVVTYGLSTNGGTRISRPTSTATLRMRAGVEAAMPRAEVAVTATFTAARPEL
jgi:hypothetical protein